MSKKTRKPAVDQEENVKGKQPMTKKQKNYVYTGIFFVVVLILFIVNNTNGEPEQGPYPPHYLESSGETLKLSDYQGKIVILDFWATWCPPCRKGIPDLIELKNEYKDKGVEIIGISLDPVTRGGSTKSKVIPFMKEYGINYPIVFGDQKIVYQYGNINSIPTSFVIDKEGNVVSQYRGLVAKSNYEKDINKILSGSIDKEQTVKAPDFELALVEK